MITGRKKGFIHSKEVRRKIGEAHIGKHHSEETKKKISKAHKGNRFTKEHRKKMSENHAKYWTGKHRSKETKRKMSETHKGDKHYNWQGGITPEDGKIRHSIEYRLWREAVFARDNWTCQKTGKRGGELNAHHIQDFSTYPELRTSIENGITLSKKAHREFHKKYGIKNNTKEQLEDYIS